MDAYVRTLPPRPAPLASEPTDEVFETYHTRFPGPCLRQLPRPREQTLPGGYASVRMPLAAAAAGWAYLPDGLPQCNPSSDMLHNPVFEPPAAPWYTFIPSW